MKRMAGWNAVLAVATAAAFFSAPCCFARQGTTKDEGAAVRDKIAGVWRGNSVCQVKDSPCHDEVNVYRFQIVAGKPDAFMVTASKIVDGKEVVMGSGEWKYDAKTKSVESEKPRIRLAILQENWMEGALSLEDGTEYRKIRLKKES